MPRDSLSYVFELLQLQKRRKKEKEREKCVCLHSLPSWMIWCIYILIYICNFYILYIYIYTHIYIYIHACMLLLQSCLTLCNTMDCNLPGSSVYGILQARILEWVAMPSSKVSFQLRDWTQVSCVFCIAEGFFTAEPICIWASLVALMVKNLPAM